MFILHSRFEHVLSLGVINPGPVMHYGYRLSYNFVFETLGYDEVIGLIQEVCFKVAGTAKMIQLEYTLLSRLPDFESRRCCTVIVAI